MFGRPLEPMLQAQVAEHEVPTGEARLAAAADAGEQSESVDGSSPWREVLLCSAAWRPVEETREETIAPPMGFVNAVRTAMLEWAKLYATVLVQEGVPVPLTLDEAIEDARGALEGVQESAMEDLRTKVERGLGLQAGGLDVSKYKPPALSFETA